MKRGGKVVWTRRRCDGVYLADLNDETFAFVDKGRSGYWWWYARGAKRGTTHGLVVRGDNACTLRAAKEAAEEAMEKIADGTWQ